MPLRVLSDFEKRNLAKLTSLSIDATVIHVTRTGLQKSILDATAPVRNYLLGNGLHDYSHQGTGAKENGVELKTVLVSQEVETQSRTSLYRPKAKGKGGDPRLWFTGLPDFMKPDEIVAIIANAGDLLCINITRDDIGAIWDKSLRGPLLDHLRNLSTSAKQTSVELLGRLKSIAERGPLPSVMYGKVDTAIGRTLEAKLGIQPNSNKEPDYKGIELKAFRSASSESSQGRKNLFAKVANWPESKFKSSKEILETFGYYRNEELRLYCTVSATVKNSQGLFFEIDDRAGHLNERSERNDIGVFATWLLEDLRNTLAKKHNETFWISAVSSEVGSHEHFELKSVIHTKKPILSQFDILLEQGQITMDHLIKRDANGQVREKGPLFKVKSSALSLLFPPSETYNF